ncbi:MAG: carboxypeptidase-like regulatory domain-containing protein [Flavobacteriaceae bacterium]
MKTKKNNSRSIKFIPLQLLMLATLFFTMVGGCSNEDPNPDSQSLQSGEISGKVTDENGNPYPSTLITISKGTDQNTKATNSEGVFNLVTKDIGSYAVNMELPLSTDAVSVNPATVNVQPNQTAVVDFQIKPIPAKAHLNFGTVQLLEEIVDKDGNTPSANNEPLYAKNNFDAPLGLLTAILAPDGHHVTLSEFKQADGNLLVSCNGNTSTVAITLEGMIPNGTYTFWLAYLKTKKKVGESIDFANDFVNFTNPPVGASNGTDNIAIADANGAINVTMEHASCILTDEVALVIPILYHINGKTFGGGHVPDAEEMVQMLVYFQ